jgi:hypothetical protein
LKICGIHTFDKFIIFLDPYIEHPWPRNHASKNPLEAGDEEN